MIEEMTTAKTCLFIPDFFLAYILNSFVVINITIYVYLKFLYFTVREKKKG